MFEKPLNPVLGETFQAKSIDGAKIYVEQTSHHPPITNFLMEGPAHFPYKLYGNLEFKLGVKGAFTSAVFSAPGSITLLLPNGVEVKL